MDMGGGKSLVTTPLLLQGELFLHGVRLTSGSLAKKCEAGKKGVHLSLHENFPPGHYATFFNLKCNKKDSGGGTVQRARTHVSCRVVLYCIVKKEDFLVNLKKLRE